MNIHIHFEFFNFGSFLNPLQRFCRDTQFGKFPFHQYNIHHLFTHLVEFLPWHQSSNKIQLDWQLDIPLFVCFIQKFEYYFGLKRSFCNFWTRFLLESTRSAGKYLLVPPGRQKSITLKRNKTSDRCNYGWNHGRMYKQTWNLK